MPGHVAQMQKLFQTAKASLRLDVRFAASTVGSIDSRLPSSPKDDKIDGSETPAQTEDIVAQTPTDWRYSTAPRLIAEFEVDVREPFPENSPQLPELLAVDVDQSKVLVAEPPSSGFTSPIDQARPALRADDVMDSSPLPLHAASSDRVTGEDDLRKPDLLSTTDLEQPLTNLRVSTDHEMDVESPDESPIVSHLRRKSGEADVNHNEATIDREEMILLSAPAKAAADSAKVKRGILTNLFPKPPSHKRSEGGLSSPRSHESEVRDSHSRPCPDPLLHERGPMVLCPNPALHFISGAPKDAGHHGVAPSSTTHGRLRDRQVPHVGFEHPATMFNRATATGSPMPLLKTIPPQLSPVEMRRNGPDSWYPPHNAPHSRPLYHHYAPSRRDYPTTTTEHFQPGWYYARETAQPSMQPGPAMYSFSTAAAKVVGHDPAPDSRIRDSYRTDTLTPLAKPPSRFKKNGIIALASARGVGKHYGGSPYAPRYPQRHMSTKPRLPDNLRFRSSPPSSFADSERTSHPGKRSREPEVPPHGISENEPAQEESIDPKLRLEEGEEVIEIDEETRAAVRMSLYGAPTPETLENGARSMKEISPNVMAWRKATRSAGSRKKRRPSYWDGDFEEVVRSQAARHVVSSPIKKDDVMSQQAEVEFHEGSLSGEVQMMDDELDGRSSTAERPTGLHDDIAMED